MKLPSIRDLVSNVAIQINNLDIKVNRLENKVGIIDERTKSYPKLYENVDKLVGEVMENRQERSFIAKRTDNHEQRLTALERHF